MPFLTANDGARLYYEIRGVGATDVILLHGMGGSGTAWRAVLQNFDLARLRILTIDVRGHGQSEGHPSTFSFARFAEDTCAIAAEVGMKNATVAGFSGGAKDAVWLATAAFRLVKRLVLVAPPGLGIVPMPREVMWPFFDEITRTKKAPPAFDAWLTDKLGDYREEVVRDYANTPLPVLRAAAELWFYGSVEDRGRLVNQPMLIIAGAREPLANAEYQQTTTLRCCPHAQLQMLDCGHWIPFEEPLALARHISAFAEGT